MTTELKKPKQVVVKKQSDSYGPIIIELGERITYLLGIIKDHAEIIKDLRSKVDQVRGRMGL